MRMAFKDHQLFDFDQFTKNYQGNVRVVADTGGNILQRVNYYPYGAPWNDDISTAGYQTHKYGEKELDLMHGLNLYDFGAREYDPALGLFTSMDPLCEKYYHISPYAYCAGNPVRLIDPSGEEPTAEEAAYIADHVYGKTNELIGGWQLYHMDSFSDGLQYGIYEREMKNGELEYVLAFAGTFDKKDWQQDISQFLGWGSASQYGNAVNLGRKFASLYDGYEKTIVGHSLGGGLATAASMVTEIPAITFNPAAMTEYTKNQLSIQDSPGRNITNYVIVGEPVTFIQNMMDMHLPGNTLYFYTKNTSSIPLVNSIEAHQMSTFKHILRK